MANRKSQRIARIEKKPSAVRSKTFPNASPTKESAWKSWALLIVTLLMCGMTFLEAPGVNGPSYWMWPWRSLSIYQSLVMIVFAIPSLSVIWIWSMSPQKLGWMLLLCAISSMMLKMGCVISQSDPPGLTYLKNVTWSPDATSYYFDAARIMATAQQDQRTPLFWLPEYDELLRTTGPSALNLHTSTKPAGPLCFYYLFVWVMDYKNPATMIVCSVSLMLLSLLSIPAVYWCVFQFTNNPQAGLVAACIVAFSPGFNLFPTKFDPLWVGLGALAIGSWHWTLVRGSWLGSCLLGLSLAAILWVGFQQLTLGLFMALTPAIVLADRKLFDRYRQAVRLGMPAIALALGIHFTLWMTSGYNTWKVFQANLWVQQRLLELPELQPRQAPWTTFWDLYDYAMGGGWTVAVVFAFCMFNSRIDRQTRLLGGAALLQLITIAVFALIPGETARCWLFLSAVPLIAIGMESAQWPRPRQMLLLGCILVATITIHCKMAFILP